MVTMKEMLLVLDELKKKEHVWHSVKEFLEIAFDHAGLHWQDYVVQDPRFMRPAEVDQLVGDATKAREKLGWEPEVSFEALVRMMVDADMEALAAPDMP